MKSIMILSLLVAAAPLYLGGNISSETSTEVPYPDGYRRWVHVRSGLTGPESPSFKTTGGLHHIYGNDRAMEGFKSGRFPDGSMIVYDLLEVQTKEGFTSEGRRRYITVMHKDSKRYTETGGWGFEVFRKNSRTDRAVGPKAKTQCYDCHASQKDKDFVFGSFRE
ncbi:MAG: cytochrome P460 family protein [Acidobacteria bacterium]|nr:cytochrome P460 family protein [Acidobacteriota bacterium]